MKTHLLYICLALTVLVLGLLAGSHLPAGMETQPALGQPVVVPDPLAPSPLPTQPPKLRATLPGNNAVVFTADGKTLASVFMKWDTYASKCAVKLWDVATAKERQSFKIAGPGDSPYSSQFSIAITPDGKALAAAYQWLGKKDGPGYAVKVWDVPSGKERAVFQDQTFLVRSVAFTRDGKLLALAGSSYKFHENGATELPGELAVKLWDLATGKDRASIKHFTTVSGVVFSADGKILASPNGFGPVLWNVPEGQVRDAFPWTGASFTCVAFTPDGKTLAAGGLEGCGIVRLWNVGTGQELATLKAHQGKEAVTALAITADGKTLASASGGYRPKPDNQVEGWGEVKLWDLPSGRAWATIKGLQCPPSSLAFTPDGKTLATVGHRGELKLWDMPVSK